MKLFIIMILFLNLMHADVHTSFCKNWNNILDIRTSKDSFHERFSDKNISDADVNKFIGYINAHADYFEHKYGKLESIDNKLIPKNLTWKKFVEKIKRHRLNLQTNLSNNHAKTLLKLKYINERIIVYRSDKQNYMQLLKPMSLENFEDIIFDMRWLIEKYIIKKDYALERRDEIKKYFESILLEDLESVSDALITKNNVDILKKLNKSCQSIK